MLCTKNMLLNGLQKMYANSLTCARVKEGKEE